MCGIVYYHSLKKKPVAKKVLKRYHAQRARGSDGFGVYRPLKDQMAHNTEEKAAIKHLAKLTDNILLFHHRMPTSTDNVRNACHPFSTKDFFKHNYVLVHNGVVNNASSLKTKHEKLGIKYVSLQPANSYGYQKFNDSEALLWEVALYIEGKIDTMEATGSIAFVCYVHEAGKNAKLFYGHNDRSPLIISKGKNHVSISSTGDGQTVPIDRLYCYNYGNGQTSSAELELSTYTRSNYSSPPYTPPAGAHQSKPADTAAPKVVSRLSGTVKPPESSKEADSKTEPYKSPAAPLADQQRSLPIGAIGATSNQYSSDLHATHTVPTVPAAPSITSVVASEEELDDDSKVLTVEDQYVIHIKQLVKHYIKEACGLYNDASISILQDIEEASSMGNSEDEAMLEAVYECIENDPFNKSYSSVHPDYIDWDTMEEVQQKRQIGFKNAGGTDKSEEE